MTKTPQWVESYRPTTQISLSHYTTRRHAPLGVAEMVIREVNRDESMERSFTQPTPLKTHHSPSQLKKSVGLANFFRTTLLAFRP